MTEPTAPPVDVGAEHRRILREIDQLTPAEWFEEWSYRYRPGTERGFFIYENRLHPAVERHVAHNRMVQKILFTLAALLTAAALLAAFWPTAKTRGRGDKEKKR
jgi:hypothetical protein